MSKFVYVVHIDEAFDIDQSSMITDVFATESLAKAELGKYIENVKKEDNYDTYVEEEMFFEAYNQGYYASDHQCMYITKLEVKGEENE